MTINKEALVKDLLRLEVTGAGSSYRLGAEAMLQAVLQRIEAQPEAKPARSKAAEK